MLGNNNNCVADTGTSAATENNNDPSSFYNKIINDIGNLRRRRRKQQQQEGESQVPMVDLLYSKSVGWELGKDKKVNYLYSPGGDQDCDDDCCYCSCDVDDMMSDNEHDDDGDPY